MIWSTKFMVYSHVQDITIWLKSEDLGHVRKISHARYAVGIIHRTTQWAVNVNISVCKSTDLDILVRNSILSGGKNLPHLHHDQSISGTGPVSSP